MSARKVIVVHGYPLTKYGGLGVNRVVLDKAVKLYSTDKYDCILLPAAINEDTGEGKSLIFERHEAYLVDHGIPQKVINATTNILSSDTWTEVLIAHVLCRDLYEWGYSTFEIHAIGFFPHSFKIISCWRRIRKDFPNFFGRYYDGVRTYHTFGSAGSLKETLRALFLCLASTVSGIYDIKGKFWPARKIKQRRRAKFTPKNLRDRVIF